METDYGLAYCALALILVTVLVQQVIASTVKARQPGAVPGVEPQNAGHADFVFRAYRTHLNSLENLPVLLGSGLLCVFAGANPLWTGIWLWVYAVARLIHMWLYYAIGTEKNPSPRSYFFLIGLLATFALVGMVARTLLAG
mgnify:CR=1 FL=1